MIVGAQKSATTSLFQYLAQHPDVVTHGQHEMTFFTEERQFNAGADYLASNYFSTAAKGQYVLGKHAMAMYSPPAIERMKRHNPGIKAIVVLREPIARAHSAFWYAKSLGAEPLASFEQGLAAEEDRLTQDWYRWSNTLYVENSSYSKHLEQIFTTLGRESVLVIFQKDLFEKSQETYRKVLAFCGLHDDVTPEFALQNTATAAKSQLLARLTYKAMRSSTLKRSVRGLLPVRLRYGLRYLIEDANKKPWKAPELSAETHGRLSLTFAEPNRRLESLLGEATRW